MISPMKTARLGDSRRCAFMGREGGRALHEVSDEMLGVAEGTAPGAVGAAAVVLAADLRRQGRSRR